jgi:hypothetical protein
VGGASSYLKGKKNRLRGIAGYQRGKREGLLAEAAQLLFAPRKDSSVDIVYPSLVRVFDVPLDLRHRCCQYTYLVVELLFNGATNAFLVSFLFHVTLPVIILRLRSNFTSARFHFKRQFIDL